MIYLVWKSCLFQTWKNNLFHTNNWRKHLAWTRKRSPQDSIILKKYWMHHVCKWDYIHFTQNNNVQKFMLSFIILYDKTTVCGECNVAVYYFFHFVFARSTHLRTNPKAYHRVEVEFVCNHFFSYFKIFLFRYQILK